MDYQKITGCANKAINDVVKAAKNIAKWNIETVDYNTIIKRNFKDLFA